MHLSSHGQSVQFDRFPTTQYFLTASYVQLGRLEDAEWQITELKMRHPSITLSHWESVGSIVDGTIKNRLFDDLRTAGMAE